jgi:hypothetical protein
LTRLLTAVTVIAAALASTGAVRNTDARCSGAQLAGSFSVVRGSAGAGNITYKLVLVNASKRTCTLTGLPQGRLLGKTGKPLPTHVKAAFPQGLAAVFVRLASGAKTFATARLSPDVPGTGEPTTGTRCEPTAWRFRVAAQGGGTTTVKLVPPTPVCEHGQLLLSAYSIKS